MDTTTRTARRPEVIAPGRGHHHHFLNHLATVKVRGATAAMSVVEFTMERGFGPPLHRHVDEDELFVVHEGELRFEAGDERTVGGAGAVLLLPAGLPHAFQVLSATARITNVCASRRGPARFDQMVAALGTPLDGPDLPPPTAIDPGRVAEVCAEHGIEVLGPPPPPLP